MFDSLNINKYLMKVELTCMKFDSVDILLLLSSGDFIFVRVLQSIKKDRLKKKKKVRESQDEEYFTPMLSCWTKVEPPPGYPIRLFHALQSSVYDIGYSMRIKKEKKN